jgi:hypothetical protein
MNESKVSEAPKVDRERIAFIALFVHLSIKSRRFVLLAS